MAARHDSPQSRRHAVAHRAGRRWIERNRGHIGPLGVVKDVGKSSASSGVSWAASGLPERYVCRAELAAIMGVSLATVDRMVAEGMPSVTWGRRTRRFTPSTAIAWAAKRGSVR